jgi:hypothetical protein
MIGDIVVVGVVILGCAIIALMRIELRVGGLWAWGYDADSSAY